VNDTCNKILGRLPSKDFQRLRSPGQNSRVISQ
jgi:hypothetical protein